MNDTSEEVSPCRVRRCRRRPSSASPPWSRRCLSASSSGAVPASSSVFVGLIRRRGRRVVGRHRRMPRRAIDGAGVVAGLIVIVAAGAVDALRRRVRIVLRGRPRHHPVRHHRWRPGGAAMLRELRRVDVRIRVTAVRPPVPSCSATRGPGRQGRAVRPHRPGGAALPADVDVALRQQPQHLGVANGRTARPSRTRPRADRQRVDSDRSRAAGATARGAAGWLSLGAHPPPPRRSRPAAARTGTRSVAASIAHARVANPCATPTTDRPGPGWPGPS